MATEALSFPKLSPPLKLYSHKAFSSIEALLPKLSLPLKIWALSWKHGLIFEGVDLMFERVDFFGFKNGFTEKAFDVWRFGVSLSMGMVSRREIFMFEVVGFTVFGNKILIFIVFVRFWKCSFFVFVNRNLILSDFDWDWK